MSSLSLPIPQFPNHRITIHKFQRITNSKTIKSELLSANPSYNFAFINPKAIISLEQLCSAIYRALLDTVAGKPKTKSIHSEIVFDLGISNKIGENLIRFGIHDESKELIVVKVIEIGKQDEIYDLKIIDGEEVDVTEEEIFKACDLNVVRDNYRIEENTEDVEYLTRYIINAIQLRGH